MDLTLEILKQTHWIIYLVFLFLVLVGLRSLRQRWMTVRQLLVLPLIFMFLNLFWLSDRLQDHFSDLSFWILGLAAGALFGWVMTRSWKVEIEAHYRALSIPATWSSLILILLFFGVRYFFLYNYEMHPEEASHLFLTDALSSGAMTGIFIGRSIQLFVKYKKKLRENH